MKSKKTSSNKPGWNSYNKANSHSNSIPPKENTLVSHSSRETTTDVSMFVDLPLTNIPSNPVNRGALQALPPIFQSLSSSQPSAVLQFAEVNVSAVRQPVGTNIFVSQGQGMDNSTEPMLET